MEKQIQLEMEMLSAGRRRYYSQIIEAESGDRGHEASYSRVLIPRYFQPLQDAIQQWLDKKSTGYLGKYRALVSSLDADVLAWFTLRAVFNSLMNELPVQYICGQIGQDIESERQFRKLTEAQPNLVKYLKSNFNKTGTESAKFMRRRLHNEVKKHTDWIQWSPNERVQVGAVMLRCFQECSDIIRIEVQQQGKKKKTVVLPSDECIDWITRHQDVHSILHHVYMPCVVSPKPWSETGSGGYYSPELQARVPFIKTKSKTSKEALSGANLCILHTAANHIQETPWKINTKVLSTLREVWKKGIGCGLPSPSPLHPTVCPVEGILKDQWTEKDKEQFIQWKMEANIVHRLERQRVSECLLFSRILSSASKFSEHSSIYFPIQCDFRGRMYSTTAAFSPQGPDYSKGLLQFALGAPIDSDDAYKWFLIHGANSYGFDKLPFDERIKNVQDMDTQIRVCGTCPLECVSFWSNTDSPWQFLAFCFEYVALHEQGRKFLSRLPIGQDGSCNGLQHFSAMLRDDVGGRAVNLVPGDRPADVYQAVADRVIDKLSIHPGEYGTAWLPFVSRKLTKKPVMTLPYGATRQNCTLSISQFAIENKLFKGEEFKAALFLSPIVWEAIEEVVIKARQAMDWLKNVASEQCSQGLPMQWTAPSGLPVVHARYKIESKEVKTMLYNVRALSMGRYTDRLMRHKQENGASPNFVHSLDASHLCFIMNRLKAEGINHVGAVHDSFSCHARHSTVLARIIREEFVRMYTEYDPLSAFESEFPVPEKGSLDINKVIDSEYFFH